MALVTLRELRRRARSRADMLLYGDVDGGTEPSYSNAFVTNEELNEHLNVYAKEYYNLITQADGENYFTKTTSASISQSNNQIALPSDFFKLQAVIYVASSTYEVKLSRASEEEFRTRNLNIPSSNIKIVYTPYLYKLVDYSDWATSTSYSVGDFVEKDSVIYHCLVAHTGGTFSTDLSDGKWEASTSGSNKQVYIDGFNGLEEYIVLRGAMFLLNKEEGSYGDISQELALVNGKIEQLKEDRDTGSADMIQDTRTDEYGYYGSSRILYRMSGGYINFVNGSGYPFYGAY